MAKIVETLGPFSEEDLAFLDSKKQDYVSKMRTQFAKDDGLFNKFTNANP